MISIKHLVKPISGVDNQSQYSHALAKTALNEKVSRLCFFLIAYFFIKKVSHAGYRAEWWHSGPVLFKQSDSRTCRDTG